MKKYKTQIIIIILGILYIFILLKYNIGIPCIFNEITGLYCPGCGITRAIASLIKFDLYQAFRYNMLIVVFIPLICIYGFIKYALKKDIKIPNWLWYLILIITILFAILRNIPFFDYLAPTTII